VVVLGGGGEGEGMVWPWWGQGGRDDRLAIVVCNSDTDK